MSATVTKLRVKDEDFLVASMIERCPRSMMLRELLKNALEAASAAPEGQRRVEFSALEVDGAPKLAIWNTGIGLTGPELYRMCDIAASIHKQTGLDRNFGMGAKVASLPSNQRGMRYRSARKGTVQEVVLGKVDGVYGRLLQPGPNGQPTEVVKVTESAAAEGRDINSEWIEVVLMGNKPGQNTVRDPYAGQPALHPGWLARTIGGRFFRLPEGVDVILQPGSVPNLRAPHKLTSLAARLSALPAYEAVTLPNGIIIHYAYDPAHPTRPGVNASQGNGPESADSLAALVYQDEMYSVLREQNWRREAPAFGIPFLARHVSIMVELPADYPVMIDGYREFLRQRDGVQAALRLQDFAGLVSRHQPGWLTRLLAQAAPGTAYAAEVQEELQNLLNTLEVPLRRPGQQPRVGEVPPPASTVPGEKPPIRLETAPALFLLRDPQEVADRELTARAACYYPDTHQLHVNLNYPVIATTIEMLLPLAPEDADPEAVAEAARVVAERGMVMRIARALAYGLAKRGNVKEWREAHIKTLLSPESLSLPAEDIRTGWAETEAAMRLALESVPKAAPAAAEVTAL